MCVCTLAGLSTVGICLGGGDKEQHTGPGAAMVNPVSGNWRPRWTVGVQCPAKRKPECSNEKRLLARFFGSSSGCLPCGASVPVGLFVPLPHGPGRAPLEVVTGVLDGPCAYRGQTTETDSAQFCVCRQPQRRPPSPPPIAPREARLHDHGNASRQVERRISLQRQHRSSEIRRAFPGK